ncbi:hypothetical protein CMV30_02940 [Nibricoccus aquaticus]|uniref:Lipoprotein SmpA/OmlA domain-containing protein n=1 Tax=Nibricoccus aquaticus TaxID=2576891 RepID=A0A290QGI5_9BACT|nr:hypothetical protein [Nibricoccus aquaticus]ATC63002.1 hypothetical protein CMV30_02940 [Nibricoccus aquaticus]
MKVFAAILLLAMCVCCGCQSEKALPPAAYSSTTIQHIATLRRGDTPEEVVRKLGAPASVAVVLPWLMYYAQEKEGFYYRVTFTLRDARKLNPEDTIEQVTLTSGIVDGPEPVVVWPTSKKKEANQPLQRNASTRPISNFESPARRG